MTVAVVVKVVSLTLRLTLVTVTVTRPSSSPPLSLISNSVAAGSTGMTSLAVGVKVGERVNTREDEREVVLGTEVVKLILI